MKIGIVINEKKINNREIVTNFVAILEGQKHSCFIFSQNEDIVGVDVLIVLGGDGAILHSAGFAAKKNIPIIGINYGNLGFLAEYERDESERILELLHKLEKGDCHILERSVLEILVGDKVYYALNEVGVQRDCVAHSTLEGQILKASISIGNECNQIAGDGLLICTPTGSTAYSLSAGGAILFPDAPVFMMTPLCALSLHSRPVVFSDKEEVCIKIDRGAAMLVIDGRMIGKLKDNQSITIRKASFTADFPMNQKAVFLKKIKSKLNK